MSIALVLCVVFGFASAGGDTRLPVPSKAELEEARKVIRSVYHDEFSAKDAALASSLLKQGTEIAGNRSPAVRYAALDECLSIYADLCNCPGITQAANAIADQFSVDGSALMVEAGARVSARTPPCLPAEELVEFFLDIADDGACKASLDVAEKSLKHAEKRLSSVQSEGARLQLKSRWTATSQLLVDLRKYPALVKNYENSPDDPKATFGLGWHLCVKRQDWEAGLRLLARGPESPVSMLAIEELHRPQTSDAQYALAQGWYAEAERPDLSPCDRSALKRHARTWYEVVRPQLAGIELQNASKRIAEVLAGPDCTVKAEIGIPPVVANEPRKPAPSQLSWAEVLTPDPDPAVVTDARLRAALKATKLPWRVRDSVSGIEMLLVAKPRGMTGGARISPFYCGRYEVQRSEWSHVMNGSPSSEDLGVPQSGLDYPTICAFLTKSPGLRLPNDDEWEFACQAGIAEDLYGPLTEIAWCTSNSGGNVHIVGQKRANAFGLHDMIGNLWELCATTVKKDVVLTIRGGTFNPNGNDTWCSSRSGRGAPVKPEERYSTRGFRVVRDP